MYLNFAGFNASTILLLIIHIILVYDMKIVYLKFEFYRAILLNFFLNNQLLTKNLLQIMSLKLEDLFFI